MHHRKEVKAMPITTENLQVGMEVKNYKVLCELMGIPESATVTGNSKISVLKDIECYIDYEKNGQKFCITEIYDEPYEKEDKRLDGLHTKYLNIIICAYLLSRSKNIEQDDCSYNMSISSWLKIVGLCNGNYKNNIGLKELYANAPHHFTKGELEEFYYKKTGRLKRYLYCSLDQLDDRRLISYSTRTMLQSDNHSKMADKEEELDIMKAERRILNKMGLRTMFQMRVRNLSQDFYKEVQEELRTNELGDYHDFSELKYYYRVIDVIYNKALMEKELNKMIREYKVELAEVLSIVIKENNTITVNSCKESNEKKYPAPKVGRLLDSDARKKDLENYLIDQLISLKNNEIGHLISSSFS